MTKLGREAFKKLNGQTLEKLQTFVPPPPPLVDLGTLTGIQIYIFLPVNVPKYPPLEPPPPCLELFPSMTILFF